MLLGNHLSVSHKLSITGAIAAVTIDAMLNFGYSEIAVYFAVSNISFDTMKY